MTVKLRYIAALAPLVLLDAPVSGQTVSVVGCSSVAANNVAKSTDKVKLAADIACLDRAGPLADAQIAAARKVRVDRLSALTPAPVPSPTPMPMPMPTGGSVPSPTLDGAAPLRATFELAKGLKAAWGTGILPGLYATDLSEGAFRFTCKGDGPLKSDDPLLYPNQPGKSHLHLFFGNRNVGADTTTASLAASTSTNCNDTPFSLNRSAYWAPAMLDEAGNVIRPDYISVYYKRMTSRSAACTPGNARFEGICIGLPNGIRFIFGWDPIHPTAKVQGASWYCSTGTNLHYDNLDDVFASGCTVGATLVANTVAPNCWNGKELDSVDHRSHMAYPSYGDTGVLKCPKTHPYLIPQEENKETWTVTAAMIGTRADGTKYSRVRLSSDAMLPGAKPGQTNHADYIEAWVAEAKALWLANCIEKALSCSGGDLGNGQQLIGS